jgi:hypothetical protein
MHTFWIILGVVVVLIIIGLLAKSGACGACDCCDDCSGCCDCTLSSLPMFVIGTVALWGGGLATVAWLLVSLIRA